MNVTDYLERCRVKPYAHQVLGIKRLVERPYFALFDEMGAGKTLQVIVAALILHARGEIDNVLVVAPGSVRGVWFDQELGELRKHLWLGTHCEITEYHARNRSWTWQEDSRKPLRWTITNYEFIRATPRLKNLLPQVTNRTFLALDETSAVKNWKAQQTRACLTLRDRCGHVVLLSGTPIANSPMDMYAQGLLMHASILNCASFFHFRAKYAVMGGYLNKQVLSWQNLDDMQRRFAPHVYRRLKIDCLDLPKKLPAVVIEFPLTPELWRMYRAMRDDMVVWLSTNTVSVAAQAVVKGMRLAQLTSGFLGGVQDAIEEDNPELQFEEELPPDPTRPSFIPTIINQIDDTTIDQKTSPLNTKSLQSDAPVQFIGHEKTSAFIMWVEDRLREDPNLKLLAWCRFRPQLTMTLEAITLAFPHITIGAIWGGQSRDRYKKIDGENVRVVEGDRERSIRLLDPRTMPKGPVIVVGTTATGSMGLTLTGAYTVIYLSNDFSLKTRLQSEDRVHRPGQEHVVSYTDLIATGPNGQRTIDHLIVKALRDKENIATWTASAWVQKLMEE